MNIFESINAVMKDCGAIAKNSVSPQNYKFRGIDAVMNALNPALIKNKVFVVPEVLDQTREERTTTRGGLLIYSVVKVKYTFYAEDGSSVSACVVGEGMDSGDKATNKAMSAAFKYACFQTFCIPTGEMKDSEDDGPEPVPLGTESTKTEPKDTPASDTTKAVIRDLCTANHVPLELWLQQAGATMETLTEAQAGRMLAALRKKYGEE